ncbi:WD40 repeat domain-containing protein [Lentzea nigeriaca]|uniref:WD40 repeat domain-containing protein n=1 Tax=Lentzea nigeriaca TaxID=1128665 RepID=UPI00195E1C98|nr:hypothetical protein [Lentzea nigeriaca]MBM7857322.1 WD40 repeat protein [Lentzea nigeriaca]
MRFIGVLVVVAVVSTAVSWLLATGLDAADKIASVVGALAAVGSLGFAVWAWGNPERGPRRSPKRVALLSGALLVVGGVPPLIVAVTAEEAPPPATKGVEWVQQAVLTGSDSRIMSLSISPNGKLIAAGDYRGEVHVWDARSGDLVKEFQVDKDVVEAVAFSPDGSRLAVGGWDTKMRTVDTDTWTVKNTFTGADDWVEALSYSADGEYIAIWSSDEVLHIRDAGSRKTVATLKDVCGAVFLDNTMLAVSTGKEIRRYDAKAKSYGDTIVTTEHSSCDLDASRGGTYLVVSGGVIGADKRKVPTRLRDLKDGKDITLQDAPAGGDATAFTHDGKHLVMSTGKGGASVWSVPDGKHVAELPRAPESVFTIATGPDGLLATGGADNVVRLFRKQQG